MAQWLGIRFRMQEVRGPSPPLGGLRVSQLQASGGISTFQSRAFGLQSTTQGNYIQTEKKQEELRPVRGAARSVGLKRFLASNLPIKDGQACAGYRRHHIVFLSTELRSIPMLVGPRKTRRKKNMGS
jgi:hypothetical protein